MSTDSAQQQQHTSQFAESEITTTTTTAIISSSSSNASSSSSPSLATAESVNQQHSNNEDLTTATASKTSTITTPTPTKKRTRATAEQLAVLEDTFAVNVSPNSKLRKQLAERLQMSERSIQIWFQNRRAKVKHMQKRAQMQMQQASIRAQLYHYHQQQYGAHPYGNHHHHHHQHQHQHHHQHGPPLMPLQPHQQQQQQYYRPQPYPTTSTPSSRVPLPRAQSVDTIQQHHPVQQPTSTTTTTPPPTHLYYPPTHPHHQQHPQQWPDTASSPTSSATPTHPYNNSTIPTLVPVPDAGPTAMLNTSDFGYAPTTPAATPPAPASMTNDLWCTPDAFDRAQSVGLAVSDPTTGELVSPVRALSDPIVTTIDPSSLMMTPPATNTSCSSGSESSQTSSQEQQQQQVDEINNSSNSNSNTSLNATTLTIGSWHRLKLRANDLLCVYQPDRRMFAWHIADNGSLFRMEISLEAVASIEYIAGECDVLADVHFDISEPPQFYMQQQKEETTTPIGDNDEQQEWIQCSDFTEGKQASRFFRHSLKGVAHHMKHELLNLMDKHEETRRLVRFIETPIPTALTAAYQPTTTTTATSIIEDPMFHPQSSSSYMYWNPMTATVATTPFMTEPCSFLS